MVLFVHKKTLFSFNSKHQVTIFYVNETLVIISVPFFQLSNTKSLYYKTCQFFNNIDLILVIVDLNIFTLLKVLLVLVTVN